MKLVTPALGTIELSRVSVTGARQLRARTSKPISEACPRCLLSAASQRCPALDTLVPIELCCCPTPSRLQGCLP